MKNGTCWLDDQGETIQAHGGMILLHGGVYYWYGENKDAPNEGMRVDVVGISCYSSKDLVTWHHEGVVLVAQPDNPQSHLHPSRVCERPKVLYNQKNNNFVMWVHVDSPDYTFAGAGVAVSDSPTGPFTYQYGTQPNRRDSRDMTVFTDLDDKVYLVHSGDWNKTLYFSELNEDYTGFTGLCVPALIDQEREAPALLAYEGKYYMVTSGCTGWLPNSALYAMSNHLLSGWKLIDNPCSGDDYRMTFYGQSTYIFEISGKPHLMLDHWKPHDLKNSGYSILPITVEGDYMEIPWQEDFIGLHNNNKA